MTLRLVLTITGLICLSLLIWLVGPLISIAEYQPLDSLWSRVFLIVLCTVLVISPVAFNWYKQRKNRRILQEGLTEQDERNQAENKKIEDTFTDAIQTLNQTQKRKRWWTAGQHLYDLPWYIIIGPPGSGKTTALRKCGLNFPLQSSSEINAIKGVGGTRHCDWWFTEDAVMIDTAGRFSTQDSHQATDAQAWNRFLQLLKKTRPKQPINGVLLTISVEDLIARPAKLNDLADKLRKRLQELTREFDIQLPVYLLITKLDLLQGFSETFASFSPEQIKEGLGFTLNDQSATAQTERLNRIDKEFSNLESKLREQVHQKLEQEPAADRRKLIFEFIEQFGTLRQPLQNCLKIIFEGEGRFFSANRLRGFYLTSGTQQGTSLARLNAELNPAMRMNYSAHHSRAYFIERVIRDVIFQERDLVGLVKRRVVLEKILKLGFGSLFVLGTTLLCVGWWISYNNNASNLNQIAQSALIAEKAINQKPNDSISIDSITLDQLNLLAELPPLNKWQTQKALWAHSLGLNQYEKISFSQKRSYQQAADNLLLPRINQRLELQLAKYSGNDSELTYEALKIYLMLHQPQYRDLQTIKEWVVYDWRLNQLSHLNNEQKRDALKHLEYAILHTPLNSLPPPQNDLIDAARQSLSVASIEERIFNKLKRLHEANNAKPFNILEKAGGDLSSLFVRASNRSLSEGPSSFYTTETYSKFFYPQLIQELEGSLSESAWVMGSRNSNSNLSSIQIQRQVRQQYVQRYIEAWQSFLSDINIRKAADLNQALEISRQLAKDRSPLERFMREVAQQTELGAPIETIAKKADEQTERAIQNKTPHQLAFLNQSSEFSGTPSSLPEMQVDQYFRSINQLFDEKSGGYAQISSLLNQLYNLLSTLDAARKEQGIPPSSTEFNAIAAQAGLLPEPIKSTIQQLASQAGVQTQKAQLNNLTAEMKPLRDLCRKSIADRYPFKSNAKLEVLPLDFIRVFSPGGVIAQHFNTHLANMVDKGAGNWRFKPSGNTKASYSSSLIQFQRAHEIEQVFFDGNQRPAFNFKMTLVGSSNPSDTFYMQYSGKLKMFSMDYEPSHDLTWPPSNPHFNLEIRSSEDSQSTTFNGYWGLFRLFDSTQRRPGAGPEEFVSRISLGPQWFDFKVTVASALNPLSLKALKQFGCPGEL